MNITTGGSTDVDNVYIEYNASNQLTLTGSVFKKVASVTQASDATSLTVSSIPTTAKSLIIIFKLRTDASGVYNDTCNVNFNNDTTTANYFSQINVGSGASIVGASDSRRGLIKCGGALTPAGVFVTGTMVLDNRSGKAHGGVSTSGTRGNSQQAYFYYDQTDQITSIVLTPQNGTNIIEDSEIIVYGSED
jgi:hypothetical protein